MALSATEMIIGIPEAVLTVFRANPAYAAMAIFVVLFGIWKIRKSLFDWRLTISSVLERWRFWSVYVVLLGLLSAPTIIYGDIRAASEIGELLIGVGMLAVPIGLYLFLDAFGEFRRYQLVAGIPTSAVRSMAGGVVELEGKAVAETTIEAPFSGADCLFYTYAVEEGLPDDDAGRDWVHQAKDSDRDAFLLDDGTGRVRVDPRGAELWMPADLSERYEDIDDAPAQVRWAMEQEGLDDISNPFRFSETYLEPGDEVYVLGEAIDRPGRASARNEQNLVVADGDSAPAFLIADSTEEELSEQLTENVRFALVGGGVLVLVGEALLVVFGGML